MRVQCRPEQLLASASANTDRLALEHTVQERLSPRCADLASQYFCTLVPALCP